MKIFIPCCVLLTMTITASSAIKILRGLMLKKIVVLALLISPITALAAPFCAVFSYGEQCFYYDYNSCLRAAGSNGACVVNQSEVKAPSGGAPFCVVASYGTQCFYYDAQSCRQAAASQGGACVVNSNR